jgi:mRNA-degrading endonuclease RelE of RelBE toxin-antitoxin system
MKRVLFLPQAARDLERLANRDRDQVEEGIERFAETGSGDVKMLAGEGRQLRLRGLQALLHELVSASSVRPFKSHLPKI